MKVLSIGSVVKAKGKKMLILGYKVFDENDKMLVGYYVTAFPRGYAGIESLGVILLEDVEEILAEGYVTSEEEQYAESLKAFAEQTQNVKASEVNRMFAKMAETFAV
ncbi:MAG: DUF4176 domain-containing protein [Lachnospiraceae bacterium]|nr:DUF4176 domain-containing protein [Lachnospiraceae bacterium]